MFLKDAGFEIGIKSNPKLPKLFYFIKYGFGSIKI